MSDADRSRKILDLCDEALAFESDARQAFLRNLAHKDPDLEAGVRLLLKAVEDSGSFMTIKESSDDETST